MPGPLSLRARVTLWTCVAAAAASFGLLDVGRRARLDPATEEAWRARERVRTDAAAVPLPPDPELKRHRTDFTVYLAAGEAIAAGQNPYDARSPREWRYVYPPLLAVALLPLRSLPAPNAALVFYLLSVVALLLAWSWTARAIGPEASGGAAAAIALLLAAPFVVQTLQRGQVTTLLLATQAGALLLLLRGRDVLAGIVLALGVALRVTPLLPAGLVVVACLRRFLRGERRAALRFPVGLAAGLVLWVAAVPLLALGPQRALEVGRQWLASSREMYAAGPGGLSDLERDYAITESTFKNQGVRRVAASVAGRLSAEASPSEAAVDAFAWGVAALAAAAGIALAWRGLSDRSDRGSPRFRRVFALGVLLPVFVTRYAWPVHYVVAVPFLAECLAGFRPAFCRRAAVVFAIGMALYYAGWHASLRALPEMGALVAGAAVAALLFVARERRAGAAP